MAGNQTEIPKQQEKSKSAKAKQNKQVSLFIFLRSCCIFHSASIWFHFNFEATKGYIIKRLYSIGTVGWEGKNYCTIPLHTYHEAIVEWESSRCFWTGWYSFFYFRNLMNSSLYSANNSELMYPRGLLLGAYPEGAASLHVAATFFRYILGPCFVNIPYVKGCIL